MYDISNDYLIFLKVRCLDSFLKQQSRLVVIVDGLDSCEQDKVLLVLDTVNNLFSENDSPFIIFLSIDPFIISKVSCHVITSHVFNLLELLRLCTCVAPYYYR